MFIIISFVSFIIMDLFRKKSLTQKVIHYSDYKLRVPSMGKGVIKNEISRASYKRQKHGTNDVGKADTDLQCKQVRFTVGILFLR